MGIFRGLTQDGTVFVRALQRRSGGAVFALEAGKAVWTLYTKAKGCDSDVSCDWTAQYLSHDPNADDLPEVPATAAEQMALLANQKYDMIAPMCGQLRDKVKVFKVNGQKLLLAPGQLEEAAAAVELGCNVVAVTYAFAKLQEIAQITKCRPRTVAIKKLVMELTQKSAVVGKSLTEAMEKLKTEEGYQEIKCLFDAADEAA